MSYSCYELTDPRPLSPPDNDFPETESELIVDGCFGIYVPQRFCQCFQRLSCVSQEDWEICLSGPDHPDYWEAWDTILGDWTYEEEDGNGGVWRIYISQDDSVFQHREFVKQKKRCDID